MKQKYSPYLKKSSRRMSNKRQGGESQSDRTGHKKKSLIEIFRLLNNNQKDDLTEMLYDEDEFKSMPEILDERKYKSKRTKKQYLQETPTRIMKDKNLEPNQYDENDVRDLYEILYLTIKENSTKINEQKPLLDSQKQKLRLKNITLRQISSVPYQFLFGDLIEFANFNKLIITKIEYKFRVAIAHQVFNHCQQLRYKEINLKLPEFKDFFRNVGNISFPNLQELYLSKCEIQSIESLGFVKMPFLRVLDLGILSMQNRIQHDFLYQSIGKICWITQNCSKHIFKQPFYDQFQGDNVINDFSKLSRLKMRKIITFRLSPAGIVSQQAFQKILQGEDLSFLSKKQFELETIRASHPQRIKQQKVIDCLSRIDNKVYMYKF